VKATPSLETSVCLASANRRDCSQTSASNYSTPLAETALQIVQRYQPLFQPDHGERVAGKSIPRNAVCETVLPSPGARHDFGGMLQSVRETEIAFDFLNPGRSLVIVPHCRVWWWRRPPASIRRTSASTVSLWTSNPAHRGIRVSMINSSLPALEDIEKCNNLLRVLSLERGNNSGFGATSRPDSIAGLPRHVFPAFILRKSRRS